MESAAGLGQLADTGGYSGNRDIFRVPGAVVDGGGTVVRKGGGKMSQRKCLFCEDVYDLDELKEMGEKYWHTKTQFVCPDCYDNLRRLREDFINEEVAK